MRKSALLLDLLHLRKTQPPVRMVVSKSPTNRRPRMASMSGAIAFLKDQASLLSPSTVDRVFSRQGHRWRRRELPPSQTMELFIRQIVAGNVPCQEVRCFG